MSLEQSFDEILNGLLADHQSQNPQADISKGSLIYLTSAALASAIWGLYRELEYQARQIFPDSSDRENLEHHATVRGLSLVPNEGDAELLARVLEHIRHPPAGGNKYDYVRWALAASPLVAKAWCVSQGQGPGTVDLVILADAGETGSEIPGAELLATVRDYVVALCPDTVKYLRVLAPEVLLQDVAVIRTGATVPASVAAANITNYLAGFLPGQALYRAQLGTLALAGGAGDADVVLPAAAVTPTDYQMIRPGVIDVA